MLPKDLDSCPSCFWRNERVSLSYTRYVIVYELERFNITRLRVDQRQAYGLSTLMAWAYTTDIPRRIQIGRHAICAIKKAPQSLFDIAARTGSVDVAARDPYGCVALHWATHWKDAEKTHILVFELHTRCRESVPVHADFNIYTPAWMGRGYAEKTRLSHSRGYHNCPIEATLQDVQWCL